MLAYLITLNQGGFLVECLNPTILYQKGILKE